jgi:hypothetical protein
METSFSGGLLVEADMRFCLPGTLDGLGNLAGALNRVRCSRLAGVLFGLID